MAQPQQRLPRLSAEAVAEGFARSGTQYVLELSNLGLESVASTLEALLPAGVRSLNLSHNRLPAFAGLPHGSELRELKLACNELSCVAVGAAARLERLLLSYNCLAGLQDAFPAGGEPLRALRVLHLEGNFLTSCEALGAACPGLTELDLSSNRLRSLAGLHALRHLETLRVRGNPLDPHALAALQCAKGELPALRDLDASRTPLASLRGLEGAAALHTLNVSRCALASLDLAGGGAALPALLELHASHNALSALPRHLATLAPLLETLDLAHNALPATQGALAPLAALAPTLVQLHLAGNPGEEAARRALVAQLLPDLACLDDAWVEEPALEEGEGSGAQAQLALARGRPGSAAARPASPGLAPRRPLPPPTLRPSSALGGGRGASAAGAAPSALGPRPTAAAPAPAAGGSSDGSGGTSDYLMDARAAIARLRSQLRAAGAAAAAAAAGGEDTGGAVAAAAAGAGASAGAGPVGGRYAAIVSGEASQAGVGGRSEGAAARQRQRGGLRDALLFSQAAPGSGGAGGGGLRASLGW